METEKSEAISLQDKCEGKKAWRLYTAYLRPNPAKDSSRPLLIPHETDLGTRK